MPRPIDESLHHPKRTHNPSSEVYWVSRVRENFKHGSYGEVLETGRDKSRNRASTLPDNFTLSALKPAVGLKNVDFKVLKS